MIIEEDIKSKNHQANGVVDVTLSNLKTEVVAASQNAVVVVLFWSPLNAACKQFASVVEKSISGNKGALKLARIDVERNPAIAQQMGVQSIPAVYAFFQGRPLDGFAGILSEAQVKAWLEKMLSATGLAGEDDVGLETAFAQAEDLIALKDFETAGAIYADILDMDANNARAYAGMVRCFLDSGQKDKALELLAAAPPAISSDKAMEKIKAAVDLAVQAQASSGDIKALEDKVLKNPADNQSRYDLSMAYYASGNKEAAVDQLLEMVQRDRAWNDAAARKQLLKFFEAFGNADPLTVSARKRLSSILFS